MTYMNFESFCNAIFQSAWKSLLIEEAMNIMRYYELFGPCADFTENEIFVFLPEKLAVSVRWLQRGDK